MNRREVIRLLPVLLVAPAVSVAATAPEYPASTSAGLTVAEAYKRLQYELNADEDYWRGWVANIACLLNDMTVPESESTARVRVELGMTPQRLVDPRNMADCNHFAEELMRRMFPPEK
jgi:hypothetical protein